MNEEKRREHEKFMALALEQAQIAFDKGEVPVGALIVKDGQVISQAHNQVEEKGSTLFHAEILVIEGACRILDNKYLEDCILYVTLEPCPMCAGAMMAARIEKLVYGADEEKTGSAGSVINLLQFPSFPFFVSIVPNILAGESAQLLKRFFQFKRN